MVQFLSINFFFLDFFNFCWVFQKFPFFCVILYNTDTFHLPLVKDINTVLLGQAVPVILALLDTEDEPTSHLKCWEPLTQQHVVITLKT